MGIRVVVAASRETAVRVVVAASQAVAVRAVAVRAVAVRAVAVRAVAAASQDAATFPVVLCSRFPPKRRFRTAVRRLSAYVG
jgi:hypothetical protein